MMAGLCPQHILWISANDVLLAPPALAEVNYLIKHLSSLFLIFNSAPAADIRNGSRDNVMERSEIVRAQSAFSVVQVRISYHLCSLSRHSSC